MMWPFKMGKKNLHSRLTTGTFTDSDLGVFLYGWSTESFLWLDVFKGSGEIRRVFTHHGWWCSFWVDPSLL